MTNKEMIKDLSRLMDLLDVHIDLNQSLNITQMEVAYLTIKCIVRALEQQPKTGHWIDVETLDSALWHECSECGETYFYVSDYCPHCGVKMTESEE